MKILGECVEGHTGVVGSRWMKRIGICGEAHNGG